MLITWVTSEISMPRAIKSVDKKGIAITFITEQEKESQAAIEELMNIKIPMLALPEDLPISDVLID